MTTHLVMRPVRDMVLGPFEIRHNTDSLTPARNLVATAIRCAAAAASVLAVVFFHIPPSTALAAGLILSLPMTLLIGGSYLINEGIWLAISTASARAFGQLAFHLSAIAGGWLLLEVHDFVSLGLLEIPLNTFLAKVTPRVQQYFS